MSPLRSAFSRLSSPKPAPGPVFELDAFEYLPVGDGVVLGRLSGSWRSSPERLVPDAHLVLRIAGVPVSVPRVPDPTEGVPIATPAGSPWRAAFRIAAEAVTGPGIEFELEFPGGVAKLPAPVERGRPASPPAPPPERKSPRAPARSSEDAPDRERLATPAPDATAVSLPQIRELEQRLADRDAELGDALRRLADADERLEAAEVAHGLARGEAEQAWAQTSSLRSLLDAAEASAQTLREESSRLRMELEAAEAARRPLEERLEAAEQQLGAAGSSDSDVQARLAAAEDELVRMRTVLSDERAAIAAERQALEAELLRIRQADAEREALEAELHEARSERDEALKLVSHAEASGDQQRSRLEQELGGRLAEEEALRRHVEERGIASGERQRILEEEIEARVAAEHDLRARLETQEAELKAARAAADSRARELQDAERRIAHSGVKREPPSDGAERPAPDDGDVLLRIESANKAAAEVE